MTRHSQTPFSYRDDPAVPKFGDSRPLFVFDGHCGLCSGGVRWLMRVDREGKIAFTSAQGELGGALYRHYGVEIDTTYLLIDRGEAYGMSGGYFRLLPYLGGAWHLFRVFGVFPEPLRDWFYRLVARNRYRWFGRYEHCELLTPDQRTRIL
jgi:predicted DCC family thiol-disulfide oxidoreductase YuxK